MQKATANPSTAQTNAALVAARDGAATKLRTVFISSDTAMTVSIVSSVDHALLWRQYVGATGGSYCESDYDLAVAPTDQGLDYSTSTNGNVFISVGFDYSR
jgi:hypothetical protein